MHPLHIPPSTSGDSPMPVLVFFFFFNDTATTEIYTLSLHDALPISLPDARDSMGLPHQDIAWSGFDMDRSEEHTSELQSPCNLVCRLLLEKKKTQQHAHFLIILSNNSRPSSP